MPDNLQSETLPMADLERNRNRAAIRRAPESAALLAFLVAEIIFFSLKLGQCLHRAFDHRRSCRGRHNASDCGPIRSVGR